MPSCKAWTFCIVRFAARCPWTSVCKSKANCCNAARCWRLQPLHTPCSCRTTRLTRTPTLMRSTVTSLCMCPAWMVRFVSPFRLRWGISLKVSQRRSSIPCVQIKAVKKRTRRLSRLRFKPFRAVHRCFCLKPSNRLSRTCPAIRSSQGASLSRPKSKCLSLHIATVTTPQR